MPHAKLTITLPESVWIGELSRAHPKTVFRVLAGTANTDSGVARIEIVGQNPERICDEMREYESVTGLTRLERDAGFCRIQLETTVPLMLTALQDSGAPIEMPLEVVDGEIALEASIPRETLSDLGETLDAVGIQYRLERIQQEVGSEALLTERQQWLLDEALERGYYDTPRRTTLVALAEELDIAKSTCSEILHRAEERVMKEYRRADRDKRPEVGVLSS